MTELNRTLGLPMLIFYGTGMILGAGIYSIIGKAAGVTGDTLWWGFIFAGISALFTALSYIELSTMFPRAGAEFVYLREAFNKKLWIGSTVGTGVAFSGAATAATVSLAFAGYLNQFFEVPQGLVAAAVLLFFSGIAIIGIRTSGWATVISTLIEIAGLLLIIYLGLKSEKFGDALSKMPHMGTLSGSALIIFSYFGFENIANLAEEVREPERNLPRAILWSIGISTLLYVLVSLSALAILSPEKLSQSNAPLMTVALVTSKNASTVLGAVALFSTANTALISLIGASRVLYSMGRSKVIFQSLSRVSEKRKTPWLASIVVFVTAALLLPLGKLETVASVSSLTTLIAFLSVNLALIKLRYSQKSVDRPFRVPLNAGHFPLLSLFGALLCLVFLTQFEMKVYLVGGTFLSVSALLFIWRNRAKV